MFHGGLAHSMVIWCRKFDDPGHSETLHGGWAVAEIDSLFLRWKLMIFEIGVWS